MGETVHIRLSLMSWGPRAVTSPTPDLHFSGPSILLHSPGRSYKTVFVKIQGSLSRHVQQQITRSATHIHRSVHLWPLFQGMPAAPHSLSLVGRIWPLILPPLALSCFSHFVTWLRLLPIVRCTHRALPRSTSTPSHKLLRVFHSLRLAHLPPVTQSLCPAHPALCPLLLQTPHRLLFSCAPSPLHTWGPPNRHPQVLPRIAFFTPLLHHSASSSHFCSPSDPAQPL